MTRIYSENNTSFELSAHNQATAATTLAAMATSLLSRVSTNFVEVANTRALKSIGDLHLSSSKASPVSSMTGSLRSIWREEGPRGLNKGLAPGLGLSATRSAVFFPIYESLKGEFSKGFGTQSGTLLASITARAAAVLLSFPLEFKATAKMAQHSASKKAPQGNIFTGLGQVAARSILQTVCFFQAYEPLQNFFSEKLTGEESVLGDYEGQVLSCTLAGGFAGLFAGVINYPVEVLRVLKISYAPEFSNMNALQVAKLLKESEKITKKVVRQSFCSTLSFYFIQNANFFFFYSLLKGSLERE